MLAEVGDFIPPFLGDEVEQLRIKIVETLDGADGRKREGDQRTRRKRIFGGALVEVRFVVVSEVVEQRVGNRAVVGNHYAIAGGALTSRRGKLCFASHASTIHRS